MNILIYSKNLNYIDSIYLEKLIIFLITRNHPIYLIGKVSNLVSNIKEYDQRVKKLTLAETNKIQFGYRIFIGKFIFSKKLWRSLLLTGPAIKIMSSESLLLDKNLLITPNLKIVKIFGRLSKSYLDTFKNYITDFSSLINLALFNIKIKPQNKNSKFNKLVYLHVIPPDFDDIISSFLLIKEFNILKYELIVIGKPEHVSTLSCFGNSNIYFHSFFSDYPPLEITGFIGSNMFVLDAIRNGVPAIIWGAYGYGGIVDGENFVTHYNNNFSGRVGGNLGESHPTDLLMEELIIMNRNLDKILFSLSSSLGKVPEDNWNHSLDSLIKEEISVIKDESRKISHLYHYKISELIDIRIIENTHFIIEKAGNSILHVIGQNEYKIISQFKEDRAISDILKISMIDLSPEETTDFIQLLYEEGIITISNDDKQNR